MPQTVYRAWESDDLPAGYLRQRRNVIGLSMVALVFVLAGGSITGEVSALWFGISLEHGWVIYPAFLVAYFYSYHRMIAYQPSFKEALEFERLEQLYALDSFKRYCQEDKQNNPGKNLRPVIEFGSDSVAINFGMRKSTKPDGFNATEDKNLRANPIKMPEAEFNQRFWNRATTAAWKNGKVSTDILLPREVWKLACWAVAAKFSFWFLFDVVL